MTEDEKQKDVQADSCQVSQFNHWPYLSVCELLQVKSESTMEPLPKKRRDGEEKEKKARSFHK